VGAAATDFPYPISLAKVGDNPRDFYERMVKEGKIKHDDRQLAALRELEKVWLKLEELDEVGGVGLVTGPGVGGHGGGRGGGFLSSWFGGGRGGGGEGPTGLYMYGGVGTNSPKSKAPSWLPIA
jgi:predicted ATPase